MKVAGAAAGRVRPAAIAWWQHCPWRCSPRNI